MSKNNQETLDLLYQSLKAGDMKIFQSYYREFKPDFIQFGKKYTQDSELILDAYHDAFIVFYENVISRKLYELHSSLKTYLFSIGKYTIYNKLKESNRMHYAEQIEFGDEEMRFSDVLTDQSEQAEEMRGYIRQLGDACQSLLILFYYRQYSIEAMMHALGYKNENTVKAYKSRCLKKLKQLIQGENKKPSL